MEAKETTALQPYQLQKHEVALRAWARCQSGQLRYHDNRHSAPEAESLDEPGSPNRLCVLHRGELVQAHIYIRAKKVIQAV